MSGYKAAAIVLAAIILLGVCNAWLGSQEERFFTAALERAGIPAPLGLAAEELTYAKALAQNNPLLALPNTDPAALAKSTSRLKELEQRLFELDAGTPNAKLLYSLYPSGFLTALSKLEAARQTFIASSTAANEAAYTAAAQKAFAAYQSDANTFTQAFTAAVPPAIGKFATDGDIVSRAGILSALNVLKQNMHTTAGMFAARTQCTRGDISKCNAGDLTTPAIAISSEVPVAPLKLAQANAVRSLSVEAHEQNAIAQGPMLLLPTTECAAHAGTGAPLFGFYTPAGGGAGQAPFPLYLGDIRFNTTGTSSSPAFQRFSAAMRERITYILDSPMLHYSCFESAHDSGKLFAMQDIYAFAQSQRLSGFATSSDAKSALAVLENKNLSLLTQHETESYLVAAGTLGLQPAAKSRLQELTLAYLFNSSHFDRNLDELLADEESNSALVKVGWPVALDVPYMFFTRSSFSMLLLADNQSAMRAQAGGIQKLFPPNTIPANKQPFVYYSQLPHTPAVIQTLIHDMHFFYIIHADPSLVAKTGGN